MEELKKKIIDIVKDRHFILFCCILIAFGLLANRLFNLQIVMGEEYNAKTTASVLRKITVQAPRGTIYDRYGRPLAENKVAFVIKIDNSIAIENETLVHLIQLLESNEEEILESIPISSERPYTFQFDGSETKERAWKKDVLELKKEENLSMTAEEIMEYLKKEFDIPEDYPEELARKVVSLRYMLYAQRYRMYQPITVSMDVSEKTVASLEENADKFPGIYVDVDSIRIYPEGEYFSHILGYTRAMDDSEYEFYKEYGYNNTDLVGKSGIEKAMELDLRGIDGEMYVEVDNLGRRINVLDSGLEEGQIAPVSGKKVFLTLDRDLQKISFDILEDTLADILINRLTSSNSRYSPINTRTFFVSMVNSNNIPIIKIYGAGEGSTQSEVKHILENHGFVLDEEKARDAEYMENFIDEAKQGLMTAIQSSQVSQTQMLFILEEQGMIILDSELRDRIRNGKTSVLNVIVEKLRAKEIRPSYTGLDPCTGSLVIEDIHTGEVLAAVSYPSYDNNELSNNFNYEYYSQLLTDPSTPLVNRPFMQRKAPGSTFKMVTAIAGLEEGIITPTTTIYDKFTFTDAGTPHAKCNGHHGSVNVTTAIEASCNYFFYETSYRMGNARSGTRLDSIEMLNKYMEAFGLNDYTGVEIDEYEPRMASPEYKETVVLSQDPDASSSDTRWTDGDTIRAAIGQSYNNFAPAHMAKYIATLANGGTRYEMHMVSKVENVDGAVDSIKTPVIESELAIQPQNLDAVLKGMLNVTSGSRGTLRGVFANYPIKVAGKTGTAQESLTRKSHTWFAGFAPYDDPQISIAVMIPYGDNPGSPASQVAKEIIAEYMGLSQEPEGSYWNNYLAQ